MGKDWDQNYSYGMDREAEAVSLIQKMYPLANVKRINYADDPDAQKRGIDLIVEQGGRTFTVQVKSRQPGKEDFCFEGHWEGKDWVWDWPEATKIIYYIPSLQPEPVIFETMDLAMLFESDPEKYQNTIWRNRQENKSTAYVPPQDLVRTMRSRNGWTKQQKIVEGKKKKIFSKINTTSPMEFGREKRRNASNGWGLRQFYM